MLNRTSKTKEERCIIFLEFLKKYTDENNKLESLMRLHHLKGENSENCLPEDFLGDKTTRSHIVKKIAWTYNTDSSCYLMDPKDWRIVYDDLLKEYEECKKYGIKKQYKDAHEFGKRHRIHNLYYNKNAEKVSIIRYIKI